MHEVAGMTDVVMPRLTGHLKIPAFAGMTVAVTILSPNKDNAISTDNMFKDSCLRRNDDH